MDDPSSRKTQEASCGAFLLHQSFEHTKTSFDRHGDSRHARVRVHGHIRIGDAMTALARDVPQPIDLILLDASKGLYLDILRLLEPGLRQRGLVVSDRTDLDGGDGGRAGAYLAYLSNPANGYRMASITTEALGQNFAHDIAVRV